MFNFKNLKLDKRDDPTNTSSFVGIRRNKNNEFEFRLPRGFEDFPENDFNATKKLFFKMYRTFRKFENDNIKNMKDTKPSGKDNTESTNSAYTFKDENDNEVLIYSKIRVIENVLEAYKDYSLNIIERQIGRTDNVDFSKIDRYLHKAVYLPDDVIFIDNMNLPRHHLNFKTASLVELYCFILHEIQNELDYDTDHRVVELS